MTPLVVAQSVSAYHVMSVAFTSDQFISPVEHPGFCPDATMKQEVVTPEVASQYLRANIVNRKLRPTVVKRYEEEMRQNSWTLTSDAIAFDEDGNLIQGQHRLNAVVKTGLAQVFWVARNMPNDSRQNLDSGSKRELHRPPHHCWSQDFQNRWLHLHNAHQSLAGSKRRQICQPNGSPSGQNDAQSSV